MKKKVAKFSILPVLGASVFFYSFSAKKESDVRTALAAEFSTANQEMVYTVPVLSEAPVPEITGSLTPVLGQSFVAFKEALGFKESSGDYSIINEFGYLGKYQFGQGTLKMIGIRDTNLFINDPDLQEAAFYANTSRNKWILRKEINLFQDKVINGVTITESGILAAAHLAGAGNVKKYLRSGGTNSFNDGFGTSIKHYFDKFGGYNTSSIVADRRAKAKLPSAI